jgi:hypothetical protein
MRCAYAAVVAGSPDRDITDLTSWTSYRVFLELFRSPIGDDVIVRPNPADLRPHVIAEIAGTETSTFQLL